MSMLFYLAISTMMVFLTVTIHGLGLNPRRTGLLAVLERMGARIAIYNRRQIGGGGLPQGHFDFGVGNRDRLGAAAIAVDDAHQLLAVGDGPFVGLSQDDEAVGEELRNISGMGEPVESALRRVLFDRAL